MSNSQSIARLREFVQELAALLQRHPTEPELLERGGTLLGRLVARDDWLPTAYAKPNPDRYQQYLLHADALGRFSVVSFGIDASSPRRAK